MQISFVMLNNHDIISLIENRLDSVSAEYQSVDNKIEIYGLDEDLIILEINQNMFSISQAKCVSGFVLALCPKFVSTEIRKKSLRSGLFWAAWPHVFLTKSCFRCLWLR